MTDDLDPKLRDFESKLRRLKPLSRDGRRQTADGSRFRRHSRVFRRYILATAVTVLAIVCLLPQRQPQPSPVSSPMTGEPVAPVVLVAVSVSEKLPTMRQQLTQLLGEIDVADAVPEKPPVYPVVEIAVCETEYKRPEFGGRHTKFDLLLSPEF